MVPDWASTSCFTMARPRPIPPVERLTRWIERGRSDRRPVSSSEAVKPLPELCTAIVAAESPRAVRSVIAPSAECADRRWLAGSQGSGAALSGRPRRSVLAHLETQPRVSFEAGGAHRGSESVRDVEGRDRERRGPGPSACARSSRSLTRRERWTVFVDLDAVRSWIIARSSRRFRPGNVRRERCPQLVGTSWTRSRRSATCRSSPSAIA